MEELKQLKRLTAKIARQRRIVDELYSEVVRLVTVASEKGATRTEVGSAAGLTPGRVQQILQGKYLAPQHKKSLR